MPASVWAAFTAIHNIQNGFLLRCDFWANYDFERAYTAQLPMTANRNGAVSRTMISLGGTDNFQGDFMDLIRWRDIIGTAE